MALGTLVERLRQDIFESRVVQTDGTWVKVPLEGQQQTKTGYFLALSAAAAADIGSAILPPSLLVGRDLRLQHDGAGHLLIFPQKEWHSARRSTKKDGYQL